MTPTFFGTDDRLFGWFALPRGEARHEGVVICGGHGDELMCSVQTLRALSMQLAEAGFPTLRFDYDGHGDSVGSDREPGRVAAWEASVHQACEALRAQSGVRRVHLVGMRLGALLATRVAAARDDIATLVAWSPVTKGRAYLRELTAFAAMSAGTEWVEREDPRVRGEGDHEVGGFFWSAESWRGLSERDAFPKVRPAPRALVIGRDELPLDDKWLAHLEGLGCEVETRQAMGFAGMMTSRHNSRRAVAVIDAIVDWLGAATPPATSPAPAPAPIRSARTAQWTEEPLRFGDSEHLFGLLTRPTQETPRPAIVLMSIGANHHIGSNGLYVRWARTWAARGFPVLRFDLSGIGDSAAAAGEPDNQPYPPGGLADAKAAIAALRARGHRRFVVLGLCSGGYHAYKLALDERDVEGLVVINPQTFDYRQGSPLDVTRRHWSNVSAAQQYKQSLLSPAKWRKLLRGEVDLRRVAGVVVDRVTTIARSRFEKLRGASPTSARASLEADLQGLCDRGTDVQLIFSKDDPGLDYLQLHGGEVVKLLRGHPRFSFVEIAGPDHTFTPLWSQLELETAVTSRLLQRYAADG